MTLQPKDISFYSIIWYNFEKWELSKKIALEKWHLIKLPMRKVAYGRIIKTTKRILGQSQVTFP